MTTRVLIADDDSIVRSAILRMLRDELTGCDVEQASDGTEALAKAQAATPALVITDGEMRRMHGPDLIAALRESPTLSAVPVILCSGNSRLRAVASSLGVPFYEKGVDSPRDLAGLVRAALGRG